MQATTETGDGDEELCELCSNDQTAHYRDDEGRAVCGTHAGALQDGTWDGEIHDVEPLFGENEARDPCEYEHVFVYGTLMAEAGYEAELRGVSKDDTGKFPTLVPDPSGRVLGEVHKVTPERLEQLDTYEGVPRLYKRVEAPGGVWVYIGNPELLGSEADVSFEHDHLQELIDGVTISIWGDSRPSDVPILEA